MPNLGQEPIARNEAGRPDEIQFGVVRRAVCHVRGFHVLLAAEQIETRQDGGDGLLLDRGQDVVALGGDRAEEGLDEIQFGWLGGAV